MLKIQGTSAFTTIGVEHVVSREYLSYSRKLTGKFALGDKSFQWTTTDVCYENAIVNMDVAEDPAGFYEEH